MLSAPVGLFFTTLLSALSETIKNQSVKNLSVCLSVCLSLSLTPPDEHICVDKPYCFLYLFLYPSPIWLPIFGTIDVRQMLIQNI